MKTKLAIFVLLALALLPSCKRADQQDSPDIPGSVTIIRFTAAPAEIDKGKSSVLSWEVDGAATATLDNGIGQVPACGEISVAPAATTTYKLEAGGKSATATVTVKQSGIPGHASIVLFTASEDHVPVYEKVVVSWEVTGAVSILLDGKVVGASGSISGTYSKTETLRLEAKGEDGQLVFKEIRIEVDTRTACVWLDAGHHNLTFTDKRTCIVETMKNESPYYAGKNLLYKVTIRDAVTNAVIDTGSGSIPIVMPGQRGSVTINFATGKSTWDDHADVDLAKIECDLKEPK